MLAALLPRLRSAGNQPKIAIRAMVTACRFCKSSPGTDYSGWYAYSAKLEQPLGGVLHRAGRYFSVTRNACSEAGLLANS
jgi:hypothetical protein